MNLEHEIHKAIADDFKVFITSMARGIDIDAGEIVLRLRTEGFPIRLICVSPHPRFERSWGGDWQRRYNSVLNQADTVRYISAGYNRGCFQKRNEWMVDHSARVIAIFNGQPSDTKNTIDYAHRQEVPVIHIEGRVATKEIAILCAAILALLSACSARSALEQVWCSLCDDGSKKGAVAKRIILLQLLFLCVGGKML